MALRACHAPRPPPPGEEGNEQLIRRNAAASQTPGSTAPPRNSAPAAAAMPPHTGRKARGPCSLPTQETRSAASSASSSRANSEDIGLIFHRTLGFANMLLSGWLSPRDDAQAWRAMTCANKATKAATVFATEKSSCTSG